MLGQVMCRGCVWSQGNFVLGCVVAEGGTHHYKLYIGDTVEVYTSTKVRLPRCASRRRVSSLPNEDTILLLTLRVTAAWRRKLGKCRPSA